MTFKALPSAGLFFVLFGAGSLAYIHIMTVYDAIDKMREISRRKGEFSFTFMSYSETSGKSDGTVDVARARLRSRPDESKNRNRDIMEAYTDLDTGEARQFYQPLLMMFNGQKVELT